MADKKEDEIVHVLAVDEGAHSELAWNRLLSEVPASDKILLLHSGRAPDFFMPPANFDMARERAMKRAELVKEKYQAACNAAGRRCEFETLPLHQSPSNLALMICSTAFMRGAKDVYLGSRDKGLFLFMDFCSLCLFLSSSYFPSSFFLTFLLTFFLTFLLLLSSSSFLFFFFFIGLQNQGTGRAMVNSVSTSAASLCPCDVKIFKTVDPEHYKRNLGLEPAGPGYFTDLLGRLFTADEAAIDRCV